MAVRGEKEACRAKDQNQLKALYRGRMLLAAGILLLGYPLFGFWIDGYLNRNPYGLVFHTQADTMAYEKAEQLACVPGQHIVRQYFDADGGYIEFIRIYLTDYVPENAGMLSVCLKDVPGQKVLKTWEIGLNSQAAAAEAVKQEEAGRELLLTDQPEQGRYITLDFEGLDCELLEQKYVLEISFNGNGDKLPFYTTKEDVYPDGDLVIDGRRQEGDLCFQAVNSVQVRSFRRTKFWLRFYAAVVLDLILYAVYKSVTRIRIPVRYHAWFIRHRVKNRELQKQKKMRFAYQPKISILVPVYHTPVHMLEHMIASVMAQSYENWELCIADGSGEDCSLEPILKQHHQKDKRIVYCMTGQNLGISGNTNKALQMAGGEFIGLLDHDDILEPDALYEVVRLLQDKETDIVYTDEDKVTEDLSEYLDPNLKPDFSIDLLRSHNYITHFLVVRKNIVNDVGGFRSAFDGAQDYDLLLRCVERTGKIRHAAKPLYHWRMCSGSTAADPQSKRYCYEAGRRALEEHLKRMGIKGDVACAEMPMWGFYHIKYDVPKNPLVSIVIANKDHALELDQCVCSIQSKSTYRNIEFVIVENNSQEKETFDCYKKLQEQYGNVKLIEWKGKFNYSAINNYGVQQSEGEYILMLNNDTEMIAPTAIEEMLGICARDDVGIVGAKLIYLNDVLQHAGVIVGLYGYAGHAFHGFGRSDFGFMMRARINGNYSAVTGACLMTKRSVFDKAGGLEERLAVAANDVDFCLKVRRQGYLVVYSAYALWYHHESITRGYEDTLAKKMRFRKEVQFFRNRWRDILKWGDPYYNKNFSMTMPPFILGWEKAGQK